MLNRWYKKEKPVFTGLRFGFGSGGGGAGGPAPPGVPFNARIIMVAGGGSGGTTQGGGGGGGGAVGFFPFAITLGTSYPFFVGHGGASPGPGGDNDGNSGEDTIWNNDPTNYKVGAGAYGGAPGAGGPGKSPGGMGGGGGRGSSGGSGSSIPGPNQPYVFGNFGGGTGHPGPGGSGGNQGGGGGGATQTGSNALGGGTPGTKGGGPGGNGKAVPADYLPDTFTATGSVGPGSTSDQFLGMATSQPAVLRRTFGGGGGGGYTGTVNWSGAGGAGSIIIQMPSSHDTSITVPGLFPATYAQIHTLGDKKYVVLVALGNSQDLPGSITFS